LQEDPSNVDDASERGVLRFEENGGTPVVGFGRFRTKKSGSIGVVNFFEEIEEELLSVTTIAKSFVKREADGGEVLERGAVTNISL
jgi:hypothetical protein